MVKQSAITPRLEICTCLALSRATRRMQRLYDAALAPHGLSIGQFSFLGHIATYEGLCPAELAERCAMDASTVSRLIRPLVERGLVRTARSAKDRRVMRLSLTPRGRRALSDAAPAWADAQTAIDDAVGAAATRQLRAAMQRIAHVI